MLTARERADLDALREHYPDARAATVSVLKWLQKERGWISDETLQDAADYLDLPAADLEGLATFYNLLFRRPVGEQVILLCDSVSCWLCGHDAVRERIRERLDIDFGETTEDGEFTFLPVVCLGDCDHAPVMMIGEELHRDLTPDRVDEILDEASRAGPATTTRPGPSTRNGDLDELSRAAAPVAPPDTDDPGSGAEVSTRSGDVGTRSEDVGTHSEDVGTHSEDVGTHSEDVTTRSQDVTTAPDDEEGDGQEDRRRSPEGGRGERRG